MKITDVSVVVHERPLPPGMPLPPMRMGVLRIRTDEGIEGNTFISPPGPDITDQIVSLVKPLLIGRDPLDIGAIWHELWDKRRSMHSTVQGHVDVALWDIAGKAADLPVHRRRSASAERSKISTTTGTKTRCPPATSTATGASSNSCRSRSWRPR